VAPFDLNWQFNFKLDELRRKVRSGAYQAIQEVFEIDIKTDAAANTPVDTGNNRRSIDTEVGEVPEGIRAEIFTQSGYGGYLELGTVKMAARPYLYPAFNKYRTKLQQLLGVRIQRATPNAVNIPGYMEKAE